MRTGAIVAILALSVALTGCSASTEAAENADTAAEAVQENEQEAAQTFEADGVTVEYRGTMDAAGNAVASFAVTNGTDAELSGRWEGVVANGEFDIQAMGGTEVPVQPGHTGSASLTFGVPTQTTLEGVGDLETIEADLLLYADGRSIAADGTAIEPAATVHVSVAV